MEEGPMSLGPMEIVGILVIVLLLFGAKKVPEIMRGFGEGLREFKKASHEAVDEIQRAVSEDPPTEPAAKKDV
jgi:sec-independent protein translocase protein TatA